MINSWNMPRNTIPRGGDAYYECWGKKEFDYFVKNFGEITKARALSMFRLEYALQIERYNFFNH